MTPAGHTIEFTRPGAHSAKNARQTGAPNTHQSGEKAMVDAVLRASLTSSGPLIVGGTGGQGKTYAMRAFLLTDPAAAMPTHVRELPVLPVREEDPR